MDAGTVNDCDDLSHLHRFYNSLQKNNSRSLNSSDPHSFSPRHVLSIKEFIESQKQELKANMSEGEGRKNRWADSLKSDFAQRVFHPLTFLHWVPGS